MEKVYFNKEHFGCWWLKELTDIYHFKTVTFDTNEEKYLFLTWTRNIDLSEYSDEVVRVYDVEIESEKFYFTVTLQNNGFILEAKDKYALERLINHKNIVFVGDTLEECDL